MKPDTQPAAISNSTPGRVRFYTTLAANSILLMLVLVALSACPSSSGMEKSRSEAFRQYETIIRWSQWDAAMDFIAPEFLQQHPVSNLELERLRLFRVTNYTLRSVQVLDQGMTAIQVAEIRMFNANQAVERTIVQQQLWRYNKESGRWRLHSGLPDPTQRN